MGKGIGAQNPKSREQSHTADLSRPACSFHRMVSSPAGHALCAFVAAAAALSPAAAQQLPQVTITGPASVREGDRLEVTAHRTGPTTVELRGGVIFVDTASNGDFNARSAFHIPPDSATGRRQGSLYRATECPRTTGRLLRTLQPATQPTRRATHRR